MAGRNSTHPPTSRTMAARQGSMLTLRGRALRRCSAALAGRQAVAGRNSTHPPTSRTMAAQRGSKLTLRGTALSCCSAALAGRQAVAGRYSTHPPTSRMMDAAQRGSRLTIWQQSGSLGRLPSRAHTGSPGWSVRPGGLQQEAAWRHCAGQHLADHCCAAWSHGAHGCPVFGVMTGWSMQSLCSPLLLQHA